jgi:hypothetical protein
MNKIEEDPIIGNFFDTPEKKAKWIVRIKFFYFLFIIFMILGISFLIFWYLFK